MVQILKSPVDLNYELKGGTTAIDLSKNKDISALIKYAKKKTKLREGKKKNLIFIFFLLVEKRGSLRVVANPLFGVSRVSAMSVWEALKNRDLQALKKEVSEIQERDAELEEEFYKEVGGKNKMTGLVSEPK